MGQIKAGIFSFFMRNIPQEVVDKQRAVVEKFNPSGYKHFQMLTELRHGYSLDGTWHLNGVNDVRSEFIGNIPQKFDFDVLLFLDIDAVPLNPQAIDLYVNQAYDGYLVGNIQRTNHIQNGEHTFVAPSAMAISKNTFLKLGKPSALETSRSDVAEEYTWRAEERGVEVIKYMPLSYEEAPAEAPNGWALATGMKTYGLGTIFGDEFRETFWHNFQVRLSGQPERFIRKCNELLKDDYVLYYVFSFWIFNSLSNQEVINFGK